MLADIELSSYLLVGGIAAAIGGLAVAGYELYRHWDAAKRLLSRSVHSAHKAVARFLKWLAESVRSAIPFAVDALVAVEPRIRIAPRRVNGGGRAVDHAAVVARPAPMLRAVRRAAAAAAFAAPLILASAPAGAFASALISSNDTAPFAPPLSAAGTTRDAIVINYAPNVVIHSEDAADSAALKRRVMEILERHGRELHQVLQREMVRQERRDFQPRYSNELK